MGVQGNQWNVLSKAVQLASCCVMMLVLIRLRGCELIRDYARCRCTLTVRNFGFRVGVVVVMILGSDKKFADILTLRKGNALGVCCIRLDCSEIIVWCDDICAINTNSDGSRDLS